MSRLTVGSIEGLTENSNVISVPTGHSLNVADAGGLQIGGSAITQGKILQVVSTIKSDTFSTNPARGTFVDVTGLSVTITPSRSANKILVLCSVSVAAGNSTASTSDPGGVMLRLIRDSTSIGLGSGGSYDATFGAISAAGLSGYSSRIPTATHYTILDSPATTSATTYKIAISGVRSPDNTVYINRAESDLARTSSTITALEVYA